MDPVPAIWGELETDDWSQQRIRVRKERMVCGTEQREEEIRGD